MWLTLGLREVKEGGGLVSECGGMWHVVGSALALGIGWKLNVADSGIPEFPRIPRWCQGPRGEGIPEVCHVVRGEVRPESAHRFLRCWRRNLEAMGAHHWFTTGNPIHH